MHYVSELYSQVLGLSEEQGASLVCDILDTLSTGLSDGDDSLAEAKLRF